MQDFIHRHPKQALHAQLALAHVQLLNKHANLAAQTLSSISSVRHMPGTVATIVALCEMTGDMKTAVSTLDQAVQHWQKEQVCL